MKIFIWMVDGNTTTLKVDDRGVDTILSVKDMIYVKQGIFPENQHLVFAGTILKDGRTLASYHINKHSIVTLALGTQEAARKDCLLAGLFTVEREPAPSSIRPPPLVVTKRTGRPIVRVKKGAAISPRDMSPAHILRFTPPVPITEEDVVYPTVDDKPAYSMVRLKRRNACHPPSASSFSAVAVGNRPCTRDLQRKKD